MASRDHAPTIGSALEFKSPHRRDFTVDVVDVLCALAEQYPTRGAGTRDYTYGEIRIALDAAIAALSSAKPAERERSRDAL